MTLHRPGDRVRLRRGRVAHVVARYSRGHTQTTPMFTLCGVPVLSDDVPAQREDPDCQGCYHRRPVRRPQKRWRG